MASIVGTPQNITSGSNYTAGSGSNRVVVIVVDWKYSTTPNTTLTTVTWNGIARSPSVQINDYNGGAGGDRDGCAICVFKESEIPAGASAATAAFSAATDGRRLSCFTVDGVDQTTTVRVTNTDITHGTNITVALASITVGDVCIGGTYTRDDNGVTTFNNGFTSAMDLSDGGGGGRLISAYKIAAATTETYSITIATASDQASAAIALIPVSAGTSAKLLTSANNGGL